MLKLVQFIKENEPQRTEGVQYWSSQIVDDQIEYTPLYADGYREAEKVSVSLPEPVVKLPIPEWIQAVAPDFGDASIYVHQMFASEAASAALEFYGLLQNYFPPK